MKTRNSHMTSLLWISALACAIATPVAVSAGEQMQIEYSKVNKSGKFELMLDDKNTGRFVFFFSYNLTFKQTKGGSLFDGVNNSGTGVAYCTQGQGNISGFEVIEKDGDSYKNVYSGSCYGVTGSDGKPVNHCSGGVFVVAASGTGRFSGLSGGGRWWGHALPNGDFEVNSIVTVEK